MMEKERTYIAIDLKSFYASVECKERNRDPLTTNLVVADKSRTEKTICLSFASLCLDFQTALSNKAVVTQSFRLLAHKKVGFIQPFLQPAHTKARLIQPFLKV